MMNYRTQYQRMPLNNQEQCHTRAKEICKQNDVFDDLIEGFQKWYYNFCLVHKSELDQEVDPQDVDLIHTWWDECCTDYKNYSNDWKSPFDGWPE